MSDSSNSEVSFKLFAYKGIDGWGLITEGEYSRIVKRAMKKLSTFVEEKE